MMEKKYGSRAEVYHGKALMTTGKLKKQDLVKNKHGYIVSLKKRKMSKNPDHNPLLKMGLLAKKGSQEFGPRKTETNNSNNSKKKSKNKNKNKKNSEKKNVNNSKKSKNSSKGFLSFLFN